MERVNRRPEGTNTEYIGRWMSDFGFRVCSECSEPMKEIWHPFLNRQHLLRITPEIRNSKSLLKYSAQSRPQALGHPLKPEIVRMRAVHQSIAARWPEQVGPLDQLQ